MERRDVIASQTLRAALTKAEHTHPGLTYDLVMGIIRKGDINVNMNESILRLQGAASDSDCEYLKILHSELFLKFPLFSSNWIQIEPFRRCIPGTKQEVSRAEENFEPNPRRNYRQKNVFRDYQVKWLYFLPFGNLLI